MTEEQEKSFLKPFFERAHTARDSDYGGDQGGFSLDLASEEKKMIGMLPLCCSKSPESDSILVKDKSKSIREAGDLRSMNKKQSLGKRKSTRRITPKPRFSERRLTSRAGLIPMSRFIDKLGIEGMIDGMVGIVRGVNADYGLGMILKAVTLGVISGCRHLSDVVRLGLDEALMRTRGVA